MARGDLPARLLVVSSSARMLVNSAARAGLAPVALDFYADADTREYAESVAAIPPGDTGFEEAALLEAAERLAPAERYPLVYGSGLDGAPELLEALARGREVHGNPPRLVRLLKTPRDFFALLRRLDIPYPESRYTPPRDPENWLLKSGCGEGGKGVRFCAQETGANPDEYFQRRMPGPPMSALFLADGANARIIGFNTLWTASHFGRPFLFVGAVNRADLNLGQRVRLARAIEALVAATGLRGLNSLDFMADGEVLRVLEINPRPSATLALYDRDFPDGLLAAHIEACRGSLEVAGRTGEAVRAFAAVFAPEVIAIPLSPAWPEWCRDRPVGGTTVPAGWPLCTVEAEGAVPAEVEASIALRKTRLLEWLAPSHG